jgi:predicted unusual protein kinase regulating ubiquinone biosynthesis (AarF/ABC1/UbiB family)
MINIAFINKILFLLNTFSIIFIEILKYLIINDYKTFIINIADKLSKKNVFYVKMIQAISTNNELFTTEINNCLLKYTNNVEFSEKDYDLNHILNTINFINKFYDNYNINLKTLIQINSGMISVVFKGVMNKKIINDNDEIEYIKKDIVIKLLRNDIKNFVDKSFENIEYLIKILNFIPTVKYFNINDIIEESKQNILLQTDFNCEVNNIRLFKNKNKNIDYLVIPEPYEIFTAYNKNIIVMDYIDGREINKIGNDEKKIYLLQLAKFGIKCILYDGIFHCDMHPGNILFVNDENKLKLGIIDYGIINTITEDEQLLYYNFFIYMFEKKYNELSLIILNNFLYPQDKYNNLNKDKKNNIINRLERIARNAFDECKTFKPKHILKMNKLLDLYNIKLSKKFSELLFSISISDSVSKQLEYDIKYIDAIKESIEEIIKTIKI